MAEQFIRIPLQYSLHRYNVIAESVRVVQKKAEGEFKMLRKHYQGCGCEQCRQMWMRSELWFDGANYWDKLQRKIDESG